MLMEPNIVAIGEGKSFKEDWDARAELLGALEASSFGIYNHKLFAEFYGAVIAHRIVELGRLKPQDRILEIGCGAGKIIKYLAPNVGSIVGVDVSPKMLRTAGEMTEGLLNVQLMQNDGYGLSFLKDGVFDFVYGYAFFIHLPAEVQWKYIYETIRVLKPGARALIEVRYNQTHKELKYTFTGDNFETPELERLRHLPGVSFANLLEISRTDSLCADINTRRWLIFRKCGEDL